MSVITLLKKEELYFKQWNFLYIVLLYECSDCSKKLRDITDHMLLILLSTMIFGMEYFRRRVLKTCHTPQSSYGP